MRMFVISMLHEGDSTVGKSAITQSFVSDGTQFAKTYNMVGQGFSYSSKNVPPSSCISTPTDNLGGHLCQTCSAARC